jgi:hypothetical protein
MQMLNLTIRNDDRCAQATTTRRRTNLMSLFKIPKNRALPNPTIAQF